jgi:hypothetical protein
MDKTPSRLLVAILLLQGLFLVGQWSGPAVYGTPARAEAFGDSGARQVQMLDELKSVNAKLDKLTEILSSGTLQVKVVRPDEDKKKTP